MVIYGVNVERFFLYVHTFAELCVIQLSNWWDIVPSNKYFSVWISNQVKNCSKKLLVWIEREKVNTFHVLIKLNCFMKQSQLTQGKFLLSAILWLFQIFCNIVIICFDYSANNLIGLNLWNVQISLLVFKKYKRISP